MSGNKLDLQLKPMVSSFSATENDKTMKTEGKEEDRRDRGGERCHQK